MLDKRFETLIVLSQTLSYTATAKKLFITQPAVTQQINSLEQELHLQLVQTTRRKISLTKAGMELATYAQRIQVESTKLIKQVQANSDDQHLKMGCTLSLSSTLLPKFIEHLSGKAKIITSEIKNTTDILNDIRTGKVDFGLIEGNFNKDEFDSIFIQNEHFICVANPQIELNGNNVNQLFDQNVFIREKGSGSREIFENWLGTQNYQIDDFEQITEIASPTVIIQLLEQNRGISFIYESLADAALASGKIKKLDLQDFQIEHPINLVYLKDSYFAKTYHHLVHLVMKS